MNCRELTRVVASDELVDGARGTRIRAWLHQRLCHYCKEYALQLRQIGAWVRESHGEDDADPVAITRLEHAIVQRALGLEPREPLA